ncbi:hypothetical protein CEXT_476331 [Caerostris extrusa]|uniref:Uncharacterized protein n=1 Tax=Caerostris extrusa TaxID=172846 RepID=A0AAV4QLE1_CAEEX|nr:hypothetical protein CEXT_476331 [Caerostris extrusa]
MLSSVEQLDIRTGVLPRSTLIIGEAIIYSKTAKAVTERLSTSAASLEERNGHHSILNPNRKWELFFPPLSREPFREEKCPR